MSGSVKKIFVTLIVIVGCVVIGAFLLNVLMPNAVNGVVSAFEGMVYNATKISIDFNGDGKGGKDSAGRDGAVAAQQQGANDAAVQGMGVDGVSPMGGGAGGK